MITGVSLFAGVGGFDLAMERNGVKVVASVEIDKHCQAVLERKFPNAKQFDDVTTVKGSDLIAAGFNPSKGILRRANRRGKTLPPVLQEALVKQASQSTQKE